VTRYSVRYIHKVAPMAHDVRPDVELPDGAFSDRKALGKALRSAGVLSSGGRIRSFRTVGAMVHAFPEVPGMTTYWHAIILEAQS
jgi:hypothetical protein